MIEEVNESIFISRFEDYKRVTTEINGKIVHQGNFTYCGLRALFQYLEDLEEEDDYILDVIALCGEYNEYKNLAEYLNDYSNQHEPKTEEESEEEFKERMEQEIGDITALIPLGDDLDKGFIIGVY